MSIAARTALTLLLALTLLPLSAAEAGKGRKAKKGTDVLRADRVVAEAEQLRDRGDLSAAVTMLQGEIAAHPANIGAHRLYQQLAALGRRSGILVEAEYRHWLNEKPEDALRQLLHAAALMTLAAVEPGRADEAMLRQIEKQVATAEADRALVAEARYVAADLAGSMNELPDAEQRLREALEIEPKHPAVRADLTLLLAARMAWDESTESCLKLIDLAPWRLEACTPLISRKSSERAAPPEQQNRIAERMETLEDELTDDVLSLQALEAFYRAVGEKKGARKLEARLQKLQPGWTAPLRRNPYIAPLPGGELTEHEVDHLERLSELHDKVGDDPWVRVTLLREFLKSLPEDVVRIRAMTHRELAYALRDEAVMDRDASRASIGAAMKLRPDDASILNEWAYMSALDKVDLPEALAAVDRAMQLSLDEPWSPLEIDPGEPFAQWEVERGESIGAYIDTRGWVLYQLGRHEESVRDLEMAALLTSDGTVQGHLGRARYAVGNDAGAFPALIRGLALGCEDKDEVEQLAQHLYEKLHVVPGGLPSLVDAARKALEEELYRATHEFELSDRGEPTDERTVPRRTEHPLIGSLAPGFGSQTLAGGSLDLDQMRGKVVVVDFWATWCQPCVEAMPAVDAMSRAFEAKDVIFVALSVDDSESLVREFWDFPNSPIQVGMAGAGVADAWRVAGIPATFVVDKEGRVAYHHAGFDATTAEALTRMVVDLLAK